MIAHENAFQPVSQRSGPGYDDAELSRKRVGLIGFGHLGRHLVELLRPFQLDVRVFDPFVSRELAEPYGVQFGPLGAVLECDVVFVLVPLTTATEGMIGAEELDRLRPGCVLVNVSRGKVVDGDALLSRLRRGDIVACLDVFDPEPLPLDSPLLDLAQCLRVPPHRWGHRREPVPLLRTDGGRVPAAFRWLGALERADPADRPPAHLPELRRARTRLASLGQHHASPGPCQQGGPALLSPCG